MGRPKAKEMIAAAREQYQREGEIEIDDNAKVSWADPDEEGGYVEAWVYVRFEGACPTTGEECCLCTIPDSGVNPECTCECHWLPNRWQDRVVEVELEDESSGEVDDAV